MSKAQLAQQKENYSIKPIYKPSQLKNILVTKKGRARSSLNQLYVVINSRFKKQKAFAKCGKVIVFNRLHTDALYTSRAELAEKLGKDEDTITRQLAELEAEGLILRDHESKKGSYNKLKIYLLKDTPHFINPNGIELDKITHLNNHTNSEYVKEKYGIDRINKVPHLKLVKSTDSDEGGILKNADTNNTGKENISQDIFSYSGGNNKPQKNNFYLVKNSETSQQKRSQQKSSLGDDFVATAETLERDWELEYSNTALPEPPEYVLADFGLAKGIFDYGHCPPEPTESVDTSITSDYVLGRVTETEPQKRTARTPILTNQANEEKPMSIPKTKLEPRQELNCQILKNFSTTTATELQQKLDIKPIAPNKLGLVFKQGLKLNADEKERLRQTLKLVYGDSIQMVLLKQNKPQIATKEDTAKRSETKVLSPAESKWEAIKNDVVNSLFSDEKLKMQINLNQAEVIALEGRKLKLRAAYSVCFKMENKQSLIEAIAKKHNVDIEMKNTSDDTTLYFPFVKPNLDFLEK